MMQIWYSKLFPDLLQIKWTENIFKFVGKVFLPKKIVLNIVSYTMRFS